MIREFCYYEIGSASMCVFGVRTTVLLQSFTLRSLLAFLVYKKMCLSGKEMTIEMLSSRWWGVERTWDRGTMSPLWTVRDKTCVKTFSKGYWVFPLPRPFPLPHPSPPSPNSQHPSPSPTPSFHQDWGPGAESWGLSPMDFSRFGWSKIYLRLSLVWYCLRRILLAVNRDSFSIH